MDTRPDAGTSFIQAGRVLLILFGLILLSSIAGALIAQLITGVGTVQLQTLDYNHPHMDVLNFFRINQVIASLGYFLLPALLIPVWVFRMPLMQFLSLRKPSGLVLYFLIILAYYVLTPMLELSGALNQHLHLGGALERLDTWMRVKEKLAGDLTRMFLYMPDSKALVFNLFFVALLPAIAEEFFFRGMLQRSLFLWTRKIHLSIFITAFIFSAIHFQFFGFLPRFLLGVFFGYLLYWTGDLRTTIMAHFLNNATSVIVAYLSLRKTGQLPDFNEAQEFPPYLYLASGLLGAMLLYMIYREARKRRELNPPLALVSDEGSVARTWTCVYKTARPSEAEIVAGMLISEGIEAVTINKRDSSYLQFGIVEVHVPVEEQPQAEAIIRGNLTDNS